MSQASHATYQDGTVVPVRPISFPKPAEVMTSREPVSVAARMSRHTEADLIRRVLGGHSQLFHDLSEPCKRTMFSIAFSILRNSADAEDAVQESTLKAFKMLASFRHEASFRTWLIQITINEAKAMSRRNRRYNLHLAGRGVVGDAGHDLARDVPDVRGLPLELVLRKEIREAVKRALISLSPAHRSVVVLRDIEGMNTEKTAELLSIAEGAVKTRLSRARVQLRKMLRAKMVNVSCSYWQ